MLRGVAILAGALVCTGGVVPSATGRSAATADLSVKFVGPNPAKPTAGHAFLLAAGIVNNGPDTSHFRLNLQAPAGVRRIGGTLECTGGPQTFNCDEADAPVGDDGTGTASFIADAAGTYTFEVSLDRLSASDPVTTNNSDTITVVVAAAQHVLAAGPLSIRPKRPTAGSVVVVSLGVRDSTAGSAVTVTGARCTASPGVPRASVLGGRATCTVKTARRRGALLRGTLTAIADGQSFSRPFSVRLR
jgi:hypothetical protein